MCLHCNDFVLHCKVWWLERQHVVLQRCLLLQCTIVFCAVQVCVFALHIFYAANSMCLVSTLSPLVLTTVGPRGALEGSWGSRGSWRGRTNIPKRTTKANENCNARIQKVAQTPCSKTSYVHGHDASLNAVRCEVLVQQSIRAC